MFVLLGRVKGIDCGRGSRRVHTISYHHLFAYLYVATTIETFS
jgi:hypothetical protein